MSGHTDTNASTARPGLLEGLRQTRTLAWRTLLQIRHNPFELGDFSIQPVLFLLLFLYVFGGAVAGSPANYLQYMLPGLVVMNSFFLTVYVGQGLNSDLTRGVFDRFRALPIARWAPLAGRIVADLVKQAWCTALLFALGFVLGFRLETSVGALLALVVLLLVVALAVSWIMVLVGILSRDPEHVQLFGFTALFPITFVSDVFVPLETLPGWLQTVVQVNPVTQLAAAGRALTGGGPVLEPVLASLAWAAAITAVFAPLSVYTLNRRLASA